MKMRNFFFAIVIETRENLVWSTTSNYCHGVVDIGPWGVSQRVETELADTRSSKYSWSKNKKPCTKGGADIPPHTKPSIMMLEM